MAEIKETQALSLDKWSSNGGGDVHQGFQSLLSEGNKTGTQYLLKTANRLFGEKTFDILASFKDSCRKFYEAEMEELDFQGDTEQSRQHINTWVTKKTEDMIRFQLGPCYQPEERDKVLNKGTPWTKDEQLYLSNSLIFLKDQPLAFSAASRNGFVGFPG
ncbi:hypothetical protein STEG23_022530, partial [Scotinomys teguina]